MMVSFVKSSAVTVQYLFVHVNVHVCRVELVLYFNALGVAMLMCQTSKKEFYKKFLYEPLLVEVSVPFPAHDFMEFIIHSVTFASLTWITSSMTISTLRW